MTTARIGAATITRIEETYGLFFEARSFFADWRDEVAAEHMAWMVPDHFDPASGFLKLSIHSWLVEIGGRKILIDTCVGNHKSRKARPFWDQLDTPYLARLAAAGVKPEEIDMVMCTTSACRSCRLEHAARQWPLGADVSERALCLQQNRL
jgi:hypothetical protein